METSATFLGSLFWGIVTFSLLVVIHEGGHFAAARLFGVRVHEFMIGLPGPAIRFTGRRTVFGITAIPLGGYVRIAGMEPGAEDDRLSDALGVALDARTVDADDLSRRLGVSRARADALLITLEDYAAVVPGAQSGSYDCVVEAVGDEASTAVLARLRASTYRGRPPWQRITILSMGVILNLLTAIFVFTLTLSVWGVPTATTTIDLVEKGKPAAVAGVRAGDTLIAVDGHSVTEWMGLLETMRSVTPSEATTLVVKRGSSRLTLKVTPAKREGRAYLGIAPTVRNVRMAPTRALVESIRWTGMVFVAVYHLFNPATFATSIQGARSVVGISVEVEKAARSGALDYAWLVALLSLSLGVMNIVPIPPLDGGKIALEVVEGIAGRPVHRGVYLAISAMGAVLLFSLIGYLMYADVVRLVQGG